MKRIRSLAGLVQAALDRKSVTCPKCRNWQRAPAAFVVNQMGMAIHHLIQSGLFIYEKAKKRK